MDKFAPEWRMHQAAKAIYGTTGEYRRLAIQNFCNMALEFLAGQS